MWATSVFGNEKIGAALLTVHCEVMPSVGFSARNSCGALTSFCRTPNIGTQFLCPAVQANSPGEFRGRSIERWPRHEATVRFVRCGGVCSAGFELGMQSAGRDSFEAGRCN